MMQNVNMDEEKMLISLNDKISILFSEIESMKLIHSQYLRRQINPFGSFQNYGFHNTVPPMASSPFQNLNNAAWMSDVFNRLVRIQTIFSSLMHSEALTDEKKVEITKFICCIFETTVTDITRV